MRRRTNHGTAKLALLIVCAVANLGAIAGVDQEGVVLSPETVVQQTLSHSKELKLLGQEVAVATARQKQARAQALPLLSADARAARYTGLEDSQFGPNFTIPAIAGRYGAGVQLSQPLFTGGRLKSLRESAVHSVEAAKQGLNGAESDIISQALNAYWSWSKAFYLGDSLQAAVSRMEGHASDMHNQHEAGLATDNETLATDVALDRTKLQFEDAQRRVDLCAARLALLTGKQLDAHSIPQKPETATPPLTTPESAMLQTAITNRAERHAREAEARSAKAQVGAARADYFPQLSLVGRYETARPNLLNIPPQDRWQDDAFAGLSVSWNIFDWGLRRAKVAEAAARSAQARLRVEQTEEQITFEVREARVNLQDAQQRTVVAERVVQSSRRNLQAATDLWQSGLSRHSDVLDAYAQLTQAEYELTAARADAELARTAIAHASGVLKLPQAQSPAPKP